MTNQKVILVTGATGAQGGSVARHLLKGGEFRVRALTRNPESAKAAALRQTGAEVVKGDLGDLRSLWAAVEGCYGVFGVTNFWEHFDQEYQQGRNLVDAVKGAGAEHLVFSSLPYVKKLTNGALEVPHFDRKGEIEEYARQVRPGSTFVHVAFYYDNFLTFFPLKDPGNGTFGFGFPQGDTPLAGVAVEDIGGVVAAIFARPLQFRDKTVGIVGDDLPPAKLAEIMTRVLGEKVVYSFIPREVFASFGFPGADDLANMFEFNRLYIRSRKADLAESRSLYPAMQSFETWIKSHKGEFHLKPEVARGTAG
ncbi:MAG: NmrA/HSCARG family protein [Bryobacteraceae bacterium]|jgi:uncharacterized protein YbjT (DUF2867 family)